VDGIFEVRDGQATRFVFHKDSRVGAAGSTGTLFYHFDHLGSVILVTGSGGAMVQEVAYRAFGAVAFHTASDAPRFAFLGNEEDQETGLVYCQSRYYDPRLGRFVSPDLLLLLHPETALESPCSLNLYLYAGNNPVKLVDKEGAWWKWLVGALVIAALVVATVVVGIFTGGAGFAFGILLMASIGSALGAGIGTYSAWRAGGNLEDGFLVGALVGGAAGAAS
jgi:RHS repeat-associated protein